MLPLNTWSPVSGGHPAGTNLAWDASQKDTADLIGDFVNLLLPFFDADYTFDGYTIYTYATVNGPAQPQVENSFTGIIGTGAATIPAAMATYVFRTAAFGQSKIILLDTAVSAAFGPKTALVSPADDDEIALVNYWTADSNAFTGRDGTQPSFWRKITYKLNDELRKEYRFD